MISTLICFIAVLSSPLSLNWEKQYSNQNLPIIEGYKYYLGDIHRGEVVYFGNKDLLGVETEVQIRFKGSKILSALLILGPAGLDDYNCLKKYKEVSSILTRKYGKKHILLDTRDPIIEDLIAVSQCKPVYLGIRTIKTIWKTKEYIIEAKLIGDIDGYYIEIQYNKIQKLDSKNKFIKSF